MKILSFLIPIFFLCAHTSVFAKDYVQPTNAKNSHSQYAKAKHNFETECVRGLAQPILLKNKVQNHHFQIKNTTGEFPILYGLETAQLGNGQSIRLENIGCESYGFDIQLILNASSVEKDQKVCQSCLIQSLRKISIYFQKEDQQFYLDGIKTLEQEYKKTKKIIMNRGLQVQGTKEIPQIIIFNEVSKQKNGQYSIRFSNSVGPL
ncbi:hypothetical protein ACG94X_12985 [Acinetobacter sp. ULE_I010]|uniref:hypothetical protein n=1 Tax=Acinetobacter sp. ULE_I010 TaxID=3373065 RepID=UPI003AF7B9F4